MMQPFDRALLRHTPAKYRAPSEHQRTALTRARRAWRRRLAGLAVRALAGFGAIRRPANVR
jgi:hypothetical protein